MGVSVSAGGEGRRVRALLRRVEGLDLASGRSVVVNQVRAFGLDREWEGPFTRLVAATGSKGGLIAALELLEAHLQGRKPSAGASPAAGALGWLAVRGIDPPDEGHVLVRIPEILYAFMGYATSQNLVMAPWTSSRELDRHRVYVRATDGLYIPDLRSLRAVGDHLGHVWFIPLHQSILLRRGAGREVIRDGRRVLVGIPLPDRSKEWLVVSRRYQWPLNREIARRGRRQRRSSDRGRGMRGPGAGSPSSGPDPAPTLARRFPSG